MCTLLFSKPFRKQHKKAPTNIQKKLIQKLNIFIIDPTHTSLNNHRLKGKYKKYYSINITGDWRALFQKVNNSTYKFYFLGTHSQLYK